MPLSWTLQNFDVLDSTQDELRRVVLKNPDCRERVVIVAACQEQGRGRHGRVWESASGNLYFSFLLRPECEPLYYGRIALSVGLAVAQAVEVFTDGGVRLKWPNDVLIDGLKCAGILIDVVDGVGLMVGVGINTALAPEGAVHLREGSQVLDVLNRFCTCFDRMYEMDFEEVRRLWLLMAHPVGEIVSVKIADRVVRGVFEGLDDLGGMIIDGQVITSGEVFLCS